MSLKPVTVRLNQKHYVRMMKLLPSLRTKSFSEWLRDTMESELQYLEEELKEEGISISKEESKFFKNKFYETEHDAYMKKVKADQLAKELEDMREAQRIEQLQREQDDHYANLSADEEDNEPEQEEVVEEPKKEFKFNLFR